MSDRIEDAKRKLEELKTALETMSERFQNFHDQTVLRSATAPREQTFQQWYDYGVAMGYCSELTCGAHDSVPMTEDEIADLDELDLDVCVPVVRIWQDGDVTGC